jgi:hypothetical protein
VLRCGGSPELRRCVDRLAGKENERGIIAIRLFAIYTLVFSLTPLIWIALIIAIRLFAISALIVSLTPLIWIEIINRDPIIFILPPGIFR